MKKILLIIFIAVCICLFTIPMCTEIYRCRRIEVNSMQGTFYYWEYAYLARTHHMCATMYSSENGQLWEVEIPRSGNPTALYVFDNRPEAEAWAEHHCPTHVLGYTIPVVRVQYQ